MQDNRFRIKGFVVWAICALFFLYEFFLRTAIGTYQQGIMVDLEINSFQFSLLSTTIFLLVYGCMQLPIGFIVDAFGLKKSLLAGVGLCVISSCGLAYSYSYALALFFRTLMGLGASFGFICLLISVHDWMPRRYSAIFIGLSQFIGTMGPMLAAGPLHTMIEKTGLGWRSLFFLLGVFGVVLGIFVLFFVEQNTDQQGGYTIIHKPEKLTVVLKKLFAGLQPWYIALVSGSLYFALEYLAENEGRLFLMLKGVSANTAAYMITASWIGFASTSPFIGFISDMIERRKIIIQTCSLIGLVAILLIVYSASVSLLYLGFFLLGISAAGQGIGFALVAEHFKKKFVAIGFGLTNAVVMLFSGLNAPFIGYILDTIKVSDHPSLLEYQYAFFVLVIASCIACFIALFCLQETYAKSVVAFTVINPNHTTSEK